MEGIRIHVYIYWLSVGDLADAAVDSQHAVIKICVVMDISESDLLYTTLTIHTG